MPQITDAPGEHESLAVIMLHTANAPKKVTKFDVKGFKYGRENRPTEHQKSPDQDAIGFHGPKGVIRLLFQQNHSSWEQGETYQQLVNILRGALSVVSFIR